MCKFSSKSGGVPFQPLGDLTWNDPQMLENCYVCHLFTPDLLIHVMIG